MTDIGAAGPQGRSELVSDAHERRIAMLEQQVQAMSELLGNQSNLILTLSQQQMDASRGLAQANELLANIARAVELPE